MIAVAAILAAVDLATTLILASKVGARFETNAVYRSVMTRYGLHAFTTLYVSTAAAIIAAASLAPAALTGYVAVMVLVVLNNLIALAHLLRR